MADPMKELWYKINKLHQLYIEAEDTPEKLDYETNLGGLIREFLSVVPHNCKFHFTETSHILEHSILSNPDFRPFNLGSAWMAMHKYASNLLSQPWRKEFTSIKLYSGFYKHQIEPFLLQGEVMLELIGYKMTEPAHMELLEPIDADKVRIVALDSLIAMVECQILRFIYEEVVKVVTSVSWKDIVEAREILAGGPEYMSKHLINKLYTSRHCHSNSYGAACATTYPGTLPCNGYGSSLPVHTASYIPPANMNGYYCQHYGHNVPSGKLIDIDPPVYPRSPPGSYTCPTSSIPTPHTVPSSHKPRDESWGYVLDTLDKPSTSSNNSKKYSTSNGYTDMERDRYTSDSHRDRYSDRYTGRMNGDRYASDVSRAHEGMKTLRLEEDEIDGEVKYRTKEERHREKMKESRTLERHRRESERERARERKRELESEKVLRGTLSPDMKYEEREEAMGVAYAGLRVNLTPESNLASLRVSLPEKEGRPNSTETKSRAPSESKKEGLRPDCKSPSVSSGSSKIRNCWDCEFCTYRNADGDICGMCSKSRNAGAELKPLESGGRQCPKCTLVNEKEARVCEACSESLEHSATYI